MRHVQLTRLQLLSRVSRCAKCLSLRNRAIAVRCWYTVTIRVLTSFVVLACCNAVCPADDDRASGGVTMSLDAEDSIGADGTILSEVIVDSSIEPWLRDENPETFADESSIPWSFEDDPSIVPGDIDCPCQACQACSGQRSHTAGNSSVRDELLRRRQNACLHCPGTRPRLQFRLGTVYMNRLDEDFRVLMESTDNPLRQLNAENFDFDWEPGMDLAISLVCWDDDRFEFRVLGLQEYSAEQRIDTSGSPVRINSAPPVFTPSVQAIDAQYLSELNGFELNWHWVTYVPFNYLAGFRFASFDEELSAVLEASPESFGYQTTTRNDLYGFQIGLTSAPDWPLFGCHCLSWFAKAGIFGNDARQRTVLQTGTIGQVVGDSPATSSVLWEFGLGLNLPIHDCLRIEGGCSALILDRIAIAGDQLSKIDFLNATGSHNRGTAMFHGAGLALVWTH